MLRKEVMPTFTSWVNYVKRRVTVEGQLGGEDNSLDRGNGRKILLQKRLSSNTECGAGPGTWLRGRWQGWPCLLPIYDGATGGDWNTSHGADLGRILARLEHIETRENVYKWKEMASWRLPPCPANFPKRSCQEHHVREGQYYTRQELSLVSLRQSSQPSGSWCPEWTRHESRGALESRHFTSLGNRFVHLGWQTNIFSSRLEICVERTFTSEKHHLLSCELAPLKYRGKRRSCSLGGNGQG